MAFFLSDCTATDRGNFHAVPGSHRRDEIEFPDEDEFDPDGAVPIQAAAGDAVFFDRRLWHASGINYSEISRKVLFYGYSYRWLRPRDNMTVDHYMSRCDPIRRQLLGAGPSGGHGYTSPCSKTSPCASGSANTRAGSTWSAETVRCSDSPRVVRSTQAIGSNQVIGHE